MEKVWGKEYEDKERYLETCTGGSGLEGSLVRGCEFSLMQSEGAGT